MTYFCMSESWHMVYKVQETFLRSFIESASVSIDFRTATH